MTRGLTAAALGYTFVLMEVETLGVPRSLGWKVHMRCANGYRQEARSMRRCVYRKQVKGASEEFSFLDLIFVLELIEFG